VFETIVVIGFVTYGIGVAGVVWGAALASLLSGIVHAAVAGRAMRRAYGASPVRASLGKLRGRRREILGFIAYSDVSALLDAVLGRLDLVVLGAMRGPTEAGLYKFAKSMASAVGYLAGPLRSAIYPRIVRLHEAGGSGDVAGLLRGVAVRTALPLAAVSVAAAFVAPLSVPILLGSAYAGASPIVGLLIAAASFGLALFWVRPVVLARGKLRPWLVLQAVGAAVSIPAYFVVAPPYGAVGIAVLAIGYEAIVHLGALVLVFGPPVAIRTARRGTKIVKPATTVETAAVR
jgi:O-antigen/teichoic acid export membrane protein